MKIRCVILDDEFLARQLLENYVQRTPFLELTHRCQNAFEAMEVMDRDKPDLLFADINIPEINGIEFIKLLKNKPEIILTTAYSEYAIEGYQLDVIEYLLKPIYFERFIKAVTRAKDLIYLKRNVPQPATALLKNETKDAELVKFEDYLFVKTGSQKITKINFEEIIFIESLHEYIRIHLLHDKHTIYCSLKNFMERLPARKFVQIHRSHIINFDKIDSVEGNTVRVGNTELKIGKIFREELFERIRKQSIGMFSLEKKVRSI